MPQIAIRYLTHFGRYGLLIKDVLRVVWRPPLEGRIILQQLDHLGVKSLILAGITAVFTGMVLALQTNYALASFGAKLYIGDVVSLGLIRELGPVLTALIVGGRVGAGITSEIGSMKVTEQVDALRALATNPIKKLVVPKIVALVIMLPLLTILADFLGIFGGLIIAVFELDIETHFYLDHVVSVLTFSDIASGLLKPVFFAFFISTIACYNGLNARGGAGGVGAATTVTVVGSTIAIITSDFFLTKLFLSIL